MALALTLLVGAASAQSSYIFDARNQTYGDTDIVTIEKFWAAYGIAVLVYGFAPPPRGVVVTSSAIFNENIAGFYDMPTTQIWINADVHADDVMLMHTLMHEIGHHLLTKQGVPIAEQHCKMYSEYDRKALMIYGVPEDKLFDYVDPFRTMMVCAR